MQGSQTGQEEVLDVLRRSELFGVLSADVLADLAGAITVQHVRGGTVVFREGDASDCMVIVMSGRLRVSRRTGNDELLLYNEICAGGSVGETGLILCQVRTADVTAVRDSTLGVLSRPAYEALLTRQPLAINRVFAQAIFDHLRHVPSRVRRGLAQSVAVIPLHGGAVAGEVAAGIAANFAAMGRTRHVTPKDIRHMLARADGLHTIARQFDELERQFDYLVYEGEAAPSELTLHAFRQSDQLLYVAESQAAPALGETERRLAAEASFPMKRQHLALLHPAMAAEAASGIPWEAGRMLERVLSLRRGNAQDYARLGRFLTGTAVGVVLGGGGARGFAHVGALRALHERGIPVDLIGGNSMGALIGAQYACEVPFEHILERTRRFALGGEWPVLPLVSLLSGRRIERDLKRMFGKAQIDTLWRPYFAATCNLTRGDTTVQHTGPLWRAVLASNSPAGLLPPVLHEGQLLVDGAILDNVPVAAMRMRLGPPLEKRRGNGTIIAIDVDVRDELKVEPQVRRLSASGFLKSRFGRRSGGMPSIGEILYCASHIGSLHQRARTTAMADLYLEPPVSGFALMDYRRAEEIAEVGYRYTMERIAQWDHASPASRRQP